MTSNEKFFKINAKQNFTNEEMGLTYDKKGCDFKKFNFPLPNCKNPPDFMHQPREAICSDKPFIRPQFDIMKDFGAKEYRNIMKQQQEEINFDMIRHCPKDSEARETYMKWPLCYVECPEIKIEKMRARKELEEYLGISQPFHNVVADKNDENEQENNIKIEYAEEWKEFIENWNKTPSLSSSKEEITCEEILTKLENEKNIENKNQWVEKNFITSKDKKCLSIERKIDSNTNVEKLNKIDKNKIKSSDIYLEDKKRFFVTNETYKVAQTTYPQYEDIMKNKKEKKYADSSLGSFEKKVIALVCYILHKFKNVEFSNLSRLIANSLEEIIDKEICKEKTLEDVVYEKMGYGIEDDEIRYAVSLVGRSMRQLVSCRKASEESLELLILPCTEKIKIPPIKYDKPVEVKIDLEQKTKYKNNLITNYRNMIDKELLKRTGKTHENINPTCFHEPDALDAKINMLVEASEELCNQRKPNENLTRKPCHKNASEWLCRIVNRKNVNEESDVWQCNHFKGSRVPLLPEKKQAIRVPSERTIRRREFCSELRKRRKEAKVSCRERNRMENNSCLVEMLKIDRLKRRDQEQSVDALIPSQPDISPDDEFLELQKRLRELKKQEKLLKKAKDNQLDETNDENMFGKSKLQCFDISLPDYLSIRDENYMRIKDEQFEDEIRTHNLPLIREMQKKERLFHLWDGKENELKTLFKPILELLQPKQTQTIDTSSLYKKSSFNLQNCINFYHMILSNTELKSKILDEFVKTINTNDLDLLLEEIVQSYPNNPSMIEWCASMPESVFTTVAHNSLDIFDEDKKVVILWSDYFQSSTNLLEDLGRDHRYLKNIETPDSYAEKNEPISPINMAKIKKIWQDLKSPEDLCQYLEYSNSELLPDVDKLNPENPEKYSGYFSKSINKMLKEILNLDLNSKLKKVKGEFEFLFEDVLSSTFLDATEEQEEKSSVSTNEPISKFEQPEKISSTILTYVDKIINEGIKIVYGKTGKSAKKKTVFIDEIEIDLDQKVSHHHKFFKKYTMKAKSVDFTLTNKQTEEVFKKFHKHSLLSLPLIAPRSEQLFAINKQKTFSERFFQSSNEESTTNYNIEEQSYTYLDYSPSKAKVANEAKKSVKVQEIEFLLTLQEELLKNKMNTPNLVLDNYSY